MIKMYVNNEEVVCDKTIEITEEFLATSSTILKNCYPKSWELTHDYVNNFYFPKDYSKCLIYNKECITFEIMGNTTQDGVPSPNNPVEIVNVTGNVNVNANNKDYVVKLGNMELCKIGNYQDYIHKIGNIWYKHKVINKIVLNGSEDWGQMSTAQANKYRWYITLNDIKRSESTSVLGNVISNRYKTVTHASGTGTYNNVEGISVANNFSRITIYDSTYNTSLEDFKNWLSTHNVTVYYAMDISIDEQITDPDLLDSLNNVGNNLLFCGVVKNTGNINLNPREPHYVDLQVLDFKTFLSEGETLDIVINEKTISQAIAMVIEQVKEYGFVVGNIQTSHADDVIGAYSTLNKTAYDVFQYLADITQCRWFTRMIDQDTVAVDFYDIDLMETANDIEYSQEYFEDNNIQDIKFSYSTSDYRNKQIMLSDEIYGSIDFNETIIADGYNQTYMAQDNIAVLKTITVNGEEKTIGTAEDKELGFEADFYYTIGKNIIESEDVYSAGSEIEISYTPLVKGRQIVIDQDEINRISTQTGRSGIISRYETRNDSLSSDELNSIGQSYIKYKGKPEIKLNIYTYNKDLYNIGNLVYFNAPLDDLKLTYMVKKKTTQIIATTGDIFYVYELSSSYNSESEINYFDNQRAKASGNIESGEYITRNVDIEHSATIVFKNLTITEVEAGNILNGALNMPFIN